MHIDVHWTDIHDEPLVGLFLGTHWHPTQGILIATIKPDSGKVIALNASDDSVTLEVMNTTSSVCSHLEDIVATLEDQHPSHR